MAGNQRQTLVSICALAVISFRVGLAVSPPGPQQWRPRLSNAYIGVPAEAGYFAFWHPMQEPVQSGGLALSVVNCSVQTTQVAGNAQRQSERSGTGNPAWKQVMACGLETAGGGAVAYACAAYAVLPLVMVDGAVWDWRRAYLTYSVPSSVLTGTATWAIGKLSGQDVSWCGGTIGAAVGALAAASGFLLHYPPSGALGSWLLVGAPTAGAVVGCNFMHWVRHPARHVQR